MGAIEIQVFVSLVVILGAAFVALICDFLKGSNEQLREANIVMRVREDERDKREELVEKVQQQTIEVVAKVQGAMVGRPASAPVPVAQAAARTQQPPAASPATLVTPVTDARELFERAQAERSARGRRGGRRAEDRAAAKSREESVASWAQDIVIRKHQDAEPAEAHTVEPVPAVEIVPAAETAPVVEAVAAVETAPVAEPLPVIETAQVVETAPVVEAAAAVEIAPVAETLLVTETAQVVETAPVAETLPVTETAQVVETAPVAEAAPLVEIAPVAETLPVIETAPAAAQVSVEPAPMPLAVPAAISTQQEFAARPDETGLPSSSTVFAQAEAEVPMAPVQPLEQAPVAAPVAQAVPEYSHLETPDARDLVVVQAPTNHETEAAPAMVDAQELPGPSPVALPIVTLPSSLQSAQVEAESVLPAAPQPVVVCQLSQATELSIGLAGPSALAAGVANLPPDSLAAETESTLPALRLHTEVPEFEIVPPSVEEFAQTVEPLATLEVPSAESLPLMVAAAEELPLETATFESPLVETSAEVAEVLESPVLESVEALVPETATAEATEEVPQTVEVAEALESPVLESVEALVPQTTIAEAIEEVRQAVEVAEVLQSPVLESVEALVPETTIAEAIEEVPQTVEVAEVLESPVLESVEAQIPETTIAEATEEVPQTVEVSEVLESPVLESVEAQVPETTIAEATEEVPQTVEVSEVLESPVLESVEAQVPETTIAEATEEVPQTVEVAEVLESPVLESVEALVPETATAEATEEVPQTVEVAEVLQSPVLESVEAQVPETDIAKAIEEVPQTVEVAEVLESPVLEFVEALVPETATAEATEEVPQTVEVAEVLESPVLESVEAQVSEPAIAEVLMEASSTADYSLIEDMPVYAEIPTLPRVEAEIAPVVEPVAETGVEPIVEPEPVSLFEPTMVESGVEEEIQVVRIRVLRDDDVLPVPEYTDSQIFLGEHSASSYNQFTNEVEPEAAAILAESPLEPVVVAEQVAAGMAEQPSAEPESLVTEMVAASLAEPVAEAEPVVAELVAVTSPEPVVETEPVVAEMAAVTWPEPAAETEPVVAELAAVIWPEPEVEAESVVAELAAVASAEPVVETEPVVAEMAAVTWPEPVVETEPVVAEMAAVTWPEPVVEAEPVVAELAAVTWPEPVVEAEPVVAELAAVTWAEPVVQAEPVVAELTAVTWPESAIEAEPVIAEAASSDPAPVEPPFQTPSWLISEEPSVWSVLQEDTRPEPVFTEATFTEAEPMFAGAASSAQAASDDPLSYKPAVPGPVVEASAPVIPQSEMRPKVVEMRSAAQVRVEQEPPAPAILELPGGFHEPTALARLLEDEAPFSGLVIAVSVVDYVRLMADQGKPAIEQIMASVTRLVMSLTREQDFACRIAEDEFILIFARENGSAAKRRIQLVSERLWDYQLRSLGSVSIIFSWGASESQVQPIVHAVENAREQMLETRRNRRNLTGVSRRFGRQVANS
jgi:GGDEF domain-containing protein